MPEHSPKSHDAEEHPDWNPALPEVVPEPTPWPAVLSLASTLIVWGFASSLFISYIGVVLFAISIGYWIGDIRHERRNQ